MARPKEQRRQEPDEATAEEKDEKPMNQFADDISEIVAGLKQQPEKMISISVSVG